MTEAKKFQENAIVHCRPFLCMPSAPSAGFGWLSRSPPLKGGKATCSALPAHPCLVPFANFHTFRTSAAVQFTKQAAKSQKVDCSFWASEQSCAVGSQECWRWHGDRVGLGCWEQEQKRRKKERKKGKDLTLGSDKLPAWFRVCVELQPEMCISPCISDYSCRSVQFPVLNYLMVIYYHVCLCTLMSPS